MQPAGAGGPIISLEEGWKLIREGIQKLENILTAEFDRAVSPFSTAEYMNIYTVCYKMCAQRTPYNWSEQLYNRHESTFRVYLQNTVLPLLLDRPGEYLLAELVKRWEHHKIMNKWMFRFFMYLNRYYREHHNLPTLEESGRTVFREVVFSVVKGKVTQAVIDIVNREREGGTGNRALLRKVVEIFEAMGEGNLDIYQADFESLLLSSTKEYYARKSHEWVEMDSCPQYCAKVEEVLLAEGSRVASYLNPSTESPLLRACERELLVVHGSRVLDKDSGLRWMLANKRKTDLARVYFLFSRVEGGLLPIAKAVKEHIQDAGLTMVRQRDASLGGEAKENPADPTFVQALVDLHEECKQLVSVEFGGNSLFHKALKDAFEVFVNKESASKHSIAELVSTFADRLLKGGIERMDDAATEDALERLVQLFSFITDKDLFGEIYRNHLSKRLLNQRSSSNELERSMISKLKLRCGAHYTSKMEGMLGDLTVAQDHQREFEKYLAPLPPLPMEFAVQILTTGFWPSYKHLDVPLPPDMMACQAAFRSFYDTRTSHRKLTWNYTLGQATVKGNYTITYDLQVTTLQALTLLVFNRKSHHVSFDELRASLNVDEEVMKRLLHSLSCGKHAVITKEPLGRTIALTDKFSFADAFACPLRKIRIPMASLDDTHNPQRVEEDRSIAIEAAIVRTMKTRKTLPHQTLISEVIQQLHFFKPNPKIIKRRIEHLIEREYLERDTADTNLYRYLA